MKDSTSCRTILITGASTGIGLALAVEFARYGHDLVLVARNKSKLKEAQEFIKAQYPVQVRTFAYDLSQTARIDELVKKIDDEKIEIDILINNAGFGDYGLFPARDPAKQLEMINLNISALTYLSHIYSAKFIANAKNQKILNVASVAGFLPGPYMATYYATKAYVISLSRALENELKPYGVQVSVLCPGPTQSEFGTRAEVSNTWAFRVVRPSAQVAREAYSKFMRGKNTIITGARNVFLVRLIKVLPYKILNFINRKILGH